MTHTPGPWTMAHDGHYGDPIPITILSHDGTIGIGAVAGAGDILDGNMGATAETWANARLIAASPTMYVVLKALLDWGREHTSPLDADSPHGLLAVAADVIEEVERTQIGWQVVDEHGHNVHGDPGPFENISSYSVFVGESITSAVRERLDNLGVMRLVPVYEGDIEEPLLIYSPAEVDL